MTGVVDDLVAEQSTLDALVVQISEAEWRRPTPAPGWSVADTVTHLAMSNEAAIASVEGRGREVFAGVMRDPDAALARQDDEARRRTGAEIRSWWRETGSQLESCLRTAPSSLRVFWGIGEMSVLSLATARLMECWAHGLDVFAAVGAQSVDTDRIRHVCHLGYRTLPYAFEFAGVAVPGRLEDLRLELESPDGRDCWRYGLDAAPQRITGSAGEFARLAVRRMARRDARTLGAEGPVADAALDVAKAYLL